MIIMSQLMCVYILGVNIVIAYARLVIYLNHFVYLHCDQIN